MSHWAALTELENSARDKLGWTSQQIAVATETQLRDAIQHHERQQQLQPKDEDEPLVVLEHRFSPHGQHSPNAIANNELLGLLITSYCLLTDEAVSADNFEKVLFPSA